MAARKIPTAADPEPVKLKGGGTVFCRRATQSMLNELVRVSGFKGENDAAGGVTLSELVIRWGVVRCEDVTDVGGNPIPPQLRTKHAKLGGLFDMKVYDRITLDKDDTSNVMTVITGESPEAAAAEAGADGLDGGAESVGGLDPEQVSD